MKSAEETIASAIKVLEIEAATLSALKSYINNSFYESVKTIYNCRGRVVITGVGKSAIIAQKIVATFNSTGTPAIFMHAADAVHGDLGMLRKDDVVICISQSGNTPEIKLLVPLLKQGGNRLFAMVGNETSYLAFHISRSGFLPCFACIIHRGKNLAERHSGTSENKLHLMCPASYLHM